MFGPFESGCLKHNRFYLRNLKEILKIFSKTLHAAVLNLRVFIL